jgi:hypothetical protein
MNNKLNFFIYLLSPIVLMLLLMLVFWLTGAAALPYGERSFIGNARTIKPWVVFDEKPKKVLISNSRGLYGYDLKRNNWDGSYNFSLTGVTTYEIGRLTQHVYFSGAGETMLYIGIDSICGPAKSTLDGSFFENDYLKDEQSFFHGLRRYKSLVSSPAEVLRRTVMEKGGVDEFGFQASFPDSSYVTGGVHKSLEVRETLDYSNFEFSSNCDSSAFTEGLKFLYGNDINFHLFVNPKHIRVFLAYREKGNLDDYFDMLKNYIDFNESIALEYGSKVSNVSFFNNISEQTTERFPVNSDVFDPMDYWYENSHFKNTVGDSVLKALAENDRNYNVNKSNVNVVLDTIQNDIESYVQRHPEIVNQVAQRIKSINE